MRLSGLGTLYEGELHSTGSSGDFYFAGSVAMPTTSSAISWFKKLQQVINRFSKPAGFAQITVDGKLGSGTTSALKKAAVYVRNTVSGAGNTEVLKIAAEASSAKDYAHISDQIAGVLESVANSLKLSTVGPKPQPSTPGDSPSTIADKPPAGKGPGLMDMKIAGFSLPVVALGVAGILWYKSKNKKGGGKKRTKR